MGIFVSILMVLCAVVVIVCTAAMFLAHKLFGGTHTDREVAHFRRTAFIAGCAASVIGFLLTLASTLTVVPTKELGVASTFGRVDYEMPNGIHLTYPWQNVTMMDGAIQLEKFEGNKFDDHGSALLVRLGNNSTAYANVNIQWRLDPKDVPSLYQDYRGFNNIRDNLVNTVLAQALNEEFSKFDPLGCVTPAATPQDPNPKCTVPDGAPLPAIQAAVQRRVQDNVGKRIIIDRVLVPNVMYNSDTETNINLVNSEKGKTRTAQQRQQTSTADAAANDILRQSVANDPNVLVSKCLDAHKDSSPIGCWPESTTAGVPIIQVPGR